PAVRLSAVAQGQCAVSAVFWLSAVCAKTARFCADSLRLLPGRLLYCDSCSPHAEYCDFTIQAMKVALCDFTILESRRSLARRCPTCCDFTIPWAIRTPRVAERARQTTDRRDASVLGCGPSLVRGGRLRP